MISVIVPVYKAEKFLHRTIHSILTQIDVDLELILVDDGSPDKSGEICDEYSAKDKRVKVIHQCNQGEIKARATGVKSATGEFLYFVDADDSIEVDTLKSMLSKMNNGIDIVAFESNMDLICSMNEFAQYLLNYKLLSVWGKLYRKSLFDQYVLDVSNYFKVGGDFLTNLRILKNIKRKIVVCSEKKYLYNTDNPDSVQRESYRSYDYEKKMITEVNNIIEKIQPSHQLQNAFINWQLSYLGGMMGFKYDIDFNDKWIVKLKNEAPRYSLCFKNRLALKAIDYKCLRNFFIADKTARRIAHRIVGI